MKTKVLFFASALLFAACSYELKPELSTGDTISFNATIEGGSRTSLDEAGKMQWNPADEIAVYTTGGFGVFTSTNTAPSKSTVFTGAFQNDNSYSGGFFAISPASAADGIIDNAIVVNLPVHQTAVQGSFDDNLFICLAESPDHQLHFSNLCGGIKFSVTSDDIQSVFFSGNGQEMLAGKAKAGIIGQASIISSIEPATTIELSAPDGNAFVPGKWYYIVSYPAEFGSGYSMTFVKSDGTRAVRKSNKSVSIKRSSWSVLANADNGLEYNVFVPANVIYYTTTDGAILQPENLGKYTIVSNQIVDGIGCMVFEQDLTSTPKSFLSGSKNLKTISLPYGLEEICDYSFFECDWLEEVNIPNGVTRIGEWAFIGCDRLSEISLPEGLTYIGPAAFGSTGLSTITVPSTVTYMLDAFSGCKLESAYILAPVPPVAGGDCFAGEGYVRWGEKPRSTIPIYVPTKSAEAYRMDYGWKDYCGHMFTMDGTLIEPYSSTDYSRDGELVQLQTATVGSGYNLILLGDGFVDKDMKPGGWYEQRAKKAIEYLWGYEPFKSLKNRFNVYAMKAVSENNFYGNRESHRRLTYNDGWDYKYLYEVRHDFCDDLINNLGLPNCIYIVFCNTEQLTFRSHAGPGHWVVMGEGVDSGGFPGVLAHEMGHAVGHLGEEYGWSDLNPLPTDEEKANLDALHSNGYYVNVAWRNNPEEVPWAHFLKDSRYSAEGLGVFLGAGGDNGHGYYRPSDSSIMRTETAPAFNAPSREAIYKFVMKATEGDGWSYDYETFVAFDAPGRRQAAR